MCSNYRWIQSVTPKSYPILRKFWWNHTLCLGNWPFKVDPVERHLVGVPPVMKWKHFPRYWPSVRRIHRSPVNSPHKGQRRGAWLFSLICVWINGWVNNREAGDLQRQRTHNDAMVMAAIVSPHHTFKMTTSHCRFRNPRVRLPAIAIGFQQLW